MQVCDSTHSATLVVVVLFPVQSWGVSVQVPPSSMPSPTRCTGAILLVAVNNSDPDSLMVGGHVSLSFCHSVILSFYLCLSVFLSFCLFVSLSFCRCVFYHRCCFQRATHLTASCFLAQVGMIVPLEPILDQVLATELTIDGAPHIALAAIDHTGAQVWVSDPTSCKTDPELTVDVRYVVPRACLPFNCGVTPLCCSIPAHVQRTLDINPITRWTLRVRGCYSFYDVYESNRAIVSR